MEAVTSLATGASLMAFTVMVAVATLRLEVLSSVASKVKVSVPFQFALGVYSTWFPLTLPKVPLDGFEIIAKE